MLYRETFTLERLKASIVARFPELASASFCLLTAGWDSVAVDVDDRLLFKFPRDEESLDALRREAAMLAVIRPHLTLPVPDLHFFDDPYPFTCHAKLPGDHLTTAQYEGLPDKSREKLAEDMARFYAELHALDPARLEAAGAQPLDPWLDPVNVWAEVEALLPENHRAAAQQTLVAASRLLADPYGSCFGYFDGHGGNMAFDHKRQHLNGIYDFGDAGLGDLHQEFIYTSFISPDLTARVIRHYERLTDRVIDRERVATLFGLLLLTELADAHDDPDHGTTVRQQAISWLATQ